jgi:hypothetical protein
MINYVPLDITYPITIISYLQKICEYVGLQFEYQKINEITWIPENSNQLIYEELFEGKGYTFRDILDKIAEVLGGNILINDDEKVTIYRLAKFPTPQFDRYVDTFDETFLKSTNINFEKKIGPINRVVIVDSESNLEFPGPWRNPESEEQYEIRIVDNEFTFNGDTYNIATGIHLEITDMEYYYCDFSTTGICYLDFLDRFLIIRNNIEYPCLLLNNEITITNGIEEHIFAEETSLTQNIGREYSTSILNSKETSLIVNKQQKEIISKVSKGDVISSINQSPEQIQIQANKISLEGKEINLTSDDVVINSTNFSVDKNGNMNCNNATASNLNINGGKIQLVANSYSDQRFVLTYSANTRNYKNAISPSGMIVYNRDNNNNYTYYESNGFSIHENGNLPVQCSSNGIGLSNSNNQTTIRLESSTGNIYCNQVNPSSIAEKKKNFEKLTNAKDILKNIDIYKYNFKFENDNEKKHIGFVIGNGFNYSKEITDSKNSGVELYSMISVLWQVVKEQQEEIDELKEMIKNGKY